MFFDEADALGSRGALVQGGPGGFRSTPGFWHNARSCNGVAYLDAATQSLLLTGAAADDVDAPRRVRDRIIMGGMGGGGGMGTLQALLTELSGLKKPRGFFNRVVRRALGMRPKPPPKYRILVMMASNMPQSLDEALLRPGRLDRIYKVGYPSKAGRIRTYRGYLEKVRHQLTDDELDRLATITPYATGATIKDVVNEALITAIRDGREVITWRDVMRAKQLKDLGPPEDVECIERERHAVAVHEACHAVVAYRVRHHLTIDLATIEKGGTYLGMVASIPPEDQFTRWRSEYEADIMVSLASLAGERRFFKGDNSSGVSGDLESATRVATMMEGFWGMGETVASHGVTRQAGIPGGGGKPGEDEKEQELLRDKTLGMRIEAKLVELLGRTEELLAVNRVPVPPWRTRWRRTKPSPARTSPPSSKVWRGRSSTGAATTPTSSPRRRSATTPWSSRRTRATPRSRPPCRRCAPTSWSGGARRRGGRRDRPRAVRAAARRGVAARRRGRMSAMLDDADTKAVLSAALSGGGDFAEVFAETRRGRNLRLDDGKIEELVSGRDRGAGIRVLRGRQTAYAYTNVLTREALVDAARVAAAAIQGQAQTRVADLTTATPAVTHPAERDPLAADRPALVRIVQTADDAARGVDGAVRQITVLYADATQDLYIANSEGHRSTEQRVRTRLVAQVVAARDGVVQTGFEGPGDAVGHELFDRHPPDQVGRLAAERAVVMLDSVPAPAGELPVVLAAGGGGVLFHEACGHGMEADIVAKDASVYAGRRGERLGTPIFTGVDDATVAGGWGSFSFDDEGTPAQRTVLFDRGVCTDYMSDRIRAAQLGIAASGNGRRQSYAHLPIPRMTNSFILPGEDDPDEIVRSVANGVYCRSLGGGQVDPASGDFVFGITEAYLIQDGEVTTPVRGANLVGDGPTVLGRVDALGTDFETRQGICGKEGQGVPVAFGTPTLRISRITVGGTG